MTKMTSLNLDCNKKITDEGIKGMTNLIEIIR